MAKKRMISSSLCESEKIMDCSSDTTRLLFVWLCLAVDDDGKMQAKPRTIKSKFFGYVDKIKEKDCEKMLKELAEIGLIVWYREKNTNNLLLEVPKWNCINSIRKDLYKPSEIPSFSRELHEYVQKSNVSVTVAHHSIDKVRLDKVRLDQFSLGVKINLTDNVTMTQYEYQSLLVKNFKNNEGLLIMAIEKLDAFKESNGREYKSDASAIRSWVADEIMVKEKPNKHQGAIDFVKES